VAGGELKISALFTLLLERKLVDVRDEGGGGKSILKELATDLRSADQLREALRDYEGLPEELKGWYRKMVVKAFA
jgi:hypothetical protein